MPMMLCKLMQLALEKSYFTNCVLYYDDLAGAGKDGAELYAKIKRVLSKLRAANLSVNPKTFA